MLRQNIFERLYKDEFKRTQEMVQKNDWYLEFGKKRRIRTLAIGAMDAGFSGGFEAAVKAAKDYTLDIYEQLLIDDEVRIGNPAEEELDFQDEGREPIDRVVIHHSNHKEGISLSRLNALHLLRLYVPRYRMPDRPIRNSAGGLQPIYSGHFDENGSQVFYGYHWKVSQDGTRTRLLDDSAIGWHAGNWPINTRSVGVVIDDDLAHSDPTHEAMESVADLIADEGYASRETADERIIGHNEASKTTQCPGDRFEKGWKPELIARVKG
jgi:hypothetical protein